MVDPAAEALGPEHVAVFDSWEGLSLAVSHAPQRLLVSAGRFDWSAALGADPELSALLHRGRRDDAYPGRKRYRPDRHTVELALRFLHKRRPRFMVLSLRDLDEYTQRGDYAGYMESLGQADRGIGRLFQILAQLGEVGRETTVLVTTDHGRRRSFRHHGWRAEAGRVWFLAAGDGVTPAGLVRSPRVTRLADI